MRNKKNNSEWMGSGIEETRKRIGAIRKNRMKLDSEFYKRLSNYNRKLENITGKRNV